METYIPRDMTPVEAIQWDGSREVGNKIIDWVRSEGMNARWTDWGTVKSYSIDVITDAMGFALFQNDWLVHELFGNGEKQFIHMTGDDFEHRFRKEEQSNLVDHAKRELARIREEPAVVEGYLAMIRVFANMGHSGGSASCFIPTLGSLLSFENLTSLTDDPDEWMQHDESVWGSPGGIYQNKRNGGAFSTDGGKTYYFLDDPAQTGDEKVMYDSAPHILETTVDGDA